MILAPRHLIPHLPCSKVDSANLWVLQMKTHFVVVDFRGKGCFGMFSQVSPRFLSAILWTSCHLSVLLNHALLATLQIPISSGLLYCSVFI